MNTTLPKFKEMREFPVMSEEEGIPLFFPAVSTAAASAVSSVLAGRWIGQGPCVEEFERCFGNFIEAPGQCISVNSGTSALHMAYVLAGVRPGKKVICPLFTCTATNLAILYAGGIPVFCDVSQDSLNMDIALIERLIDSDTVAISVVDYGGLPCNYRELRSICDKYNLKLISDLAHCIDGKFDGKRVHSYTDFACFSFQAIKTLTTGDGGCLFVSDPKDFESAIKMRWFGIDRKAKQSGTWSNDISHLGFKYHMNDIAASIGLSNLTFIPDLLRKRREIFT
jgi:perosamine synthetase